MTISFELDWNAVKKLNSGVDFHKCNQGSNRIRLVGKPSYIESHYSKDQAGTTHRITCLGEDCPICETGKAPVAKVVSYGLDRDDENKLKVVEVAMTAARQIKALAKDDEYGDPQNYDVNLPTWSECQKKIPDFFKMVFLGSRAAGLIYLMERFDPAK